MKIILIKVFFIVALSFFPPCKLYSQSPTIVNWDTISLYVRKFNLDSNSMRQISVFLRIDMYEVENRLIYFRNNFLDAIINMHQAHVLRGTDDEIEEDFNEGIREEIISKKIREKLSTANAYITPIITFNQQQNRLEVSARISDFKRGFIGMAGSVDFTLFQLTNNDHVKTQMDQLAQAIIKNDGLNTEIVYLNRIKRLMISYNLNLSDVSPSGLKSTIELINEILNEYYILVKIGFTSSETNDAINQIRGDMESLEIDRFSKIITLNRGKFLETRNVDFIKTIIVTYDDEISFCKFHKNCQVNINDLEEQRNSWTLILNKYED